MALAFKVYDLDESGYITLHEFMTILRVASKHLKNSDAIQKIAALGQDHFFEYDTGADGKGHINKAEFSRMLHDHPELIDELLGLSRSPMSRADSRSKRGKK